MLTLPRSLAAQVNHGRRNQLLLPPFELPPPELHLYWHANAEEDPANRWLRDLVVRSFKS